MKDRHGLLIGDTTAEMLKKKIGSVHPRLDRGMMKVYGRSLKNGLGEERIVTSREIRVALSGKVSQMLAAIKNALENTPPELSADIFDLGIMLTGGGALLGGLPQLITEHTGIRVTVSKNPLESVCLGIGRVIESSGALGSAVKFRQK